MKAFKEAVVRGFNTALRNSATKYGLTEEQAIAILKAEVKRRIRNIAIVLLLLAVVFYVARLSA